jgi:hypothetical protein
VGVGEKLLFGQKQRLGRQSGAFRVALRKTKTVSRVLPKTLKSRF